MRTVNEIKEYYKDDNLHCENPECEEAIRSSAIRTGIYIKRRSD